MIMKAVTERELLLLNIFVIYKKGLKIFKNRPIYNIDNYKYLCFIMQRNALYP